jgi:hypothetical protein
MPEEGPAQQVAMGHGAASALLVIGAALITQDGGIARVPGGILAWPACHRLAAAALMHGWPREGALPPG